RPNEIVRLCPKLPTAAPPATVIEFRPAMPMAFEASSMTFFGSSAETTQTESVVTRTAAAADAFPIDDGSGIMRKPVTRVVTGRRRQHCAVARWPNSSPSRLWRRASGVRCARRPDLRHIRDAESPTVRRRRDVETLLEMLPQRRRRLQSHRFGHAI